MKKLLHSRLPALAMMIVLTLAAYLAFLIPSGAALELRDRDSNTRIASWPIQAGDELRSKSSIPLSTSRGMSSIP